MNRDQTIDSLVKDAKQRSLYRWPELLEAAGLDASYLKKKGGPCPFCGGTDRYSFDDKYDVGNYFCRGCGPGDGFKLLGHVLGKGFLECCEFVIRWTGGMPVERRQLARAAAVRKSTELTPEEIAKRKARHKRTWSRGLRVTEGDPVWKYLHGRLPELAAVPAVLRFHPGLPYFEEGETKGELVKVGVFPAMLAAIQGPDGVCCNIHRTFLTEEGEKAPVAHVRKKELSLKVKGGAVRLFPLPGAELSVAEGIETSLAVNILRGEACWPMVDAQGMEEFVVPEEVSLVRIYQDNDLPDQRGRRRGFEAGKALAERVKASGKRAVLYAPAKAGQDMNDFIRGLARR